MPKSIIAGIGFYVPENVVTNKDLEKRIDTSDEWIQERTGIKERRFITRFKETTGTIGAKAARIAIKRAGLEPEDIDFLICATLSSDYFFPGSGVIIQRELGINKGGIGCLDVRNQCSGFVYALSVADQYIRSGMYKNILVVGAEVHSTGVDFTTRGRDVCVIFGDGAGAVVLQPTEDPNRGILGTKLHADGEFAEKLAMINPGSHSGVHIDGTPFGFDKEDPFASLYLTQAMYDNSLIYPTMEGQFVFRMAVMKFPEVIKEVLDDHGYSPEEIDLLVPHQANLRISQFVQKRMKLRDDQVVNNIDKYGNTTAASIPIALCEAWEEGRVKEGDLICLAAFGSGFTWASALLRW